MTRDKKNCVFIYHWAFLIYVFVWEDMLVFTLFLFSLVNVSFYFHDVRILLLGMSLFYCVRSAGETLYYFLQQFLQPKHHPHDVDRHFIHLRRIVGPISFQKSLIMMQVAHQMVMVFSLLVTVLLLLHWQTITL